MSAINTLAQGIADKYNQVTELRRKLTTIDMAGLECVETLKVEQLMLEIAGEGVMLAQLILRPSK